MAYGYEDLSRAQEDVIRVMKAHGNILIKKHGFWTYENCEFHKDHNSNIESACAKKYSHT